MNYSLSVHIQTLLTPKAFTEKQVRALVDVFEPHDIEVNVKIDELDPDPDIVELLRDLDINPMDGPLTTEQEKLLSFSDPAPTTITAFLLRSTNPPVMGWSAAARRSVVVTLDAGKWVLAHEIGHVLLGTMSHVSSPARLMAEGAPADKVFFRENQPPLLVWPELIKIESSGLLFKIS